MTVAAEQQAKSPIEISCADIAARMEHAGIGDDEWDALPRPHQYDRLATLIGGTPIEAITDLGHGLIVTKLEMLNLSGSHYDRAYLETLRAFEEEGLIKPGDELRDITSGSAGISLAVLGQALGYKVRITVPDELPENRLFPMRWFGAEVRSAGPGYIRQASEVQAQEIIALKDEPGWETRRPVDREQRAFVFERNGARVCYLNHSENSLSPRAFRSIASEVVAQLAEPPSSVILAMGNWTTIAGVSPVLREAWPDTRLIGFEGEKTDIHDNFGTTVAGVPLRFQDNSLIDERVVITDAQRNHYDAVVNASLPLSEQLGHSSVMAIAAADTEAGRAAGHILTIAYDTKLRY